MTSSYSFPGRGRPDAKASAFAGKYRIIRKLGIGGLGPVYLAEHLEIGHLTAIKILRDSIAENPEAVRQFTRGAQNASRIHHPHVCAVYDVGVTDDSRPYVAMEYVEGGSLADVLARMPRLKTERACRIALQVLEALGAAHALGIVHRDLKPGNIILAVGDDGDDHVKVLDFDIAGRMAVDSDLTDARLLIGSPEYMSPEQLGGGKLDGRSDLYSLGIILYRVVTGHFPFSAKGAQELMLKRLTEDPIPLRQVSPGGRFPPGLQELLDAALARDPRKRFASAEEMSWALAQVADPRAFEKRPGRRTAETAAEPTRGQTTLEDAEWAERGRPFIRSPLVRVLAYWWLGVVAGMIMGLIPTPFSGRDDDRTGEAAVQAAEATVPRASSADATSPGAGLVSSDEVADDLPVFPPALTDPAATDDVRGAEAPPAGIENPGVRTELADLLEGLPGATREGWERTAARADEFYQDESLPPALRAEAAYVVASAFAMLQDIDAMIQWSRVALRHNPSHGGVAELLDAVTRP